MIDANRASSGYNEQYRLKWGNFEKCISSEFKKIREDSELVDITFVCEGETYGAHKLVLFACSSYFKSILKVNPCSHPIFYMNGIKHSVVKAILDFMYLGEIHIHHEDLEGFFDIADQFKIRGVTRDPEICQSYGKNSLDVTAGNRTLKHKKPRLSVAEQLPESEQKPLNILNIVEPKTESPEFSDETCQPEFSNSSSVFSDNGVARENSRIFGDASYQDTAGPSTETTCDESWVEEKSNYQIATDLEQKFKIKSNKAQCLVPSSCPMCGRLYSNISNLRQHMRLIHNPTSVCCPICQKSFNSDLYLKRHYLSMHNTVPEAKPHINPLVFNSEIYSKRPNITMSDGSTSSTSKISMNQTWNPYETDINQTLNID